MQIVKVTKKIVVTTAMAALFTESCLAATLVQRVYKNVSQNVSKIRQKLTESDGKMVFSSSFAPTKPNDPTNGGIAGSYAAAYSRKLSERSSLAISSKWGYAIQSGGSGQSNYWDNAKITYSRTKFGVLDEYDIDTSAGVQVEAEGRGVRYGAKQKGSTTVYADMKRGGFAVVPSYSIVHNSGISRDSNISAYGILVHSDYSPAEKWNLNVAWLDYDVVTKKDARDATATKSTAELTYSTQWSKSVKFTAGVETTFLEEIGGKFTMDNVRERTAYGIRLDLAVF